VRESLRQETGSHIKRFVNASLTLERCGGATPHRPLIGSHCFGLAKSTHRNPTPATDGRHLVTIFGSEGLFCFDTSGNRVWRNDLGPMDSGYYEVPSAPAGTNAAIAWVHPRRGDYMQTPIVVSNRVYGCTDGGVLTCFDATDGKMVYSERLGGPTQGFTASPVSDGRRLYFSGETGKVLVVPVSDQFSVVATNDLDDLCMATPAISAGALFFRTRSRLIAVGGS
jgi:outer membrane protein assembly factor BamB